MFSSLNNLKISLRFTLGLSLILLLMISITAIAIIQVDKINDSLTVINDKNSVMQRYTINFRGSVHDRAIALRDVILAGTDEDDRRNTLKIIDKLTEDYAKSAGPLDAMFAGNDNDPAEVKILEEIKAIEVKTLPLITKVVNLQYRNQPEEAHRVLMQEARPAFVEWLAAINKFIDIKEAKNQTIGKEVRGIAQRFEMLMALICGMALLLGMVICFWIVSSIRPLKSLTSVMLKLADGDMGVEVPANDARNEVGDISRSIKIFKDKTIEAEALKEKQRKEEHAQIVRSEKVRDAIALFEGQIKSVTDGLSHSASSMNEMAAILTEATEKTNQQSQSAASFSSEASTNVETVASATEELSASIREISRNIRDASENAKQCRNSAEDSQSKLKNLQLAMNDIDSVIQSINGVAEQTNLLALNATIEAARAGDAGKGFAVVASEVKSLANETHKMTEEISGKIEYIKNSANETISSVNKIISQIASVDETTSMVALAIEQQDQATAEISRNILQASSGTTQASQSILQVQQAANDTDSSTRQVKTASDHLKVQAEDLESAVTVFLDDVRKV